MLPPRFVNSYLSCGVVLLSSALIVDCSSEVAPVLPDVVSSSRYIDYRTYADVDALCVDDALSREDRFVEGVAAFLSETPPSGRINFVWDPRGESEFYKCKDNLGCYFFEVDKNYGVIISPSNIHYHELVHAVEIPLMGASGRFLAEGFAEYLGSDVDTGYLLADFRGRFDLMLKGESQSNYYPVAMHFVGSLIELYGVEKYKKLRAGFSEAVDFAQFFETIYGLRLDDALSEMSARSIRGKKKRDGCMDDDVELVEWNSQGHIEALLEGECGDGWFVSGGGVDGRLAFNKEFGIEIFDSGFYEIELDGPEGTKIHPEGSLVPCDAGNGLSALGGFAGYGKLQSGKYVLSVGFPQSEALRGEARLRLTFFGP